MVLEIVVSRPTLDSLPPRHEARLQRLDRWTKPTVFDLERDFADGRNDGTHGVWLAKPLQCLQVRNGVRSYKNSTQWSDWTGTVGNASRSLCNSPPFAPDEKNHPTTS